MPPAGYLSSSSIETLLVLINAAYPGFTQLVPLPETSVEGRLIRALRIRGGGGKRNGVLIVGGAHARELINPDALVGLAYKLCWAYDNHLGITLGGKVWSNTDVRAIVDGLDVFILPNMNPDGREYVRSTDPWWRKNRSFNADGTRGTDLNRNYDFLWPWTIGQTSNFPAAETYHGSAPFSEPESRNVRSLLENFPDITSFCDVHSYSELILYPWGDDDAQSSDPTQNFLNPIWDGLRGTFGGYAEYMPAVDNTRFANIANRMRAAIAAVRGCQYTVEPSVDLYPTSGTGHDYAYSRFFHVGAKRKVWGFAIESNRSNGDPQFGFQPPYDEALRVSLEVQSGLIQLMLSSVCLVREVGRGIVTNEVLDDLSAFRDLEMLESRRGRRWVDLLETHGEEVLGLLSADRTAWQAARKLLARGAALVAKRGAATPARIDRALVGEVQRLLARVDKAASPALKTALKEIGADVRRMPGKTVAQLLA